MLGPDAVQGERRRNLRLLHHRYGDECDRLFMTTVTRGRVDKGMPNWSGVLTEEQFQKIRSRFCTRRRSPYAPPAACPPTRRGQAAGKIE